MQFWMPLRLCVHYVMKSVISFCLKMKWKQLSLQFLKNTLWAKALWNELRCHEFQPKHSSKEKPVKMWLNMLHRRLSPKNEGPKRLDRRVQTGDVLGNFFLNFSECKKSPFRLWCFVQRRKTHRCNLLSPREQTYSRFCQVIWAKQWFSPRIPNEEE